MSRTYYSRLRKINELLDGLSGRNSAEALALDVAQEMLEAAMVSWIKTNQGHAPKKKPGSSKKKAKPRDLSTACFLCGAKFPAEDPIEGVVPICRCTVCDSLVYSTRMASAN